MLKHILFISCCCLCIVSCKKTESKGDNDLTPSQDSIPSLIEPIATAKRAGFGLYDHHRDDAYKTLDVSHLLGVSYLSYELNPNTGDAISTYDWETTALIDSLHAHNVKSFLTITDGGEANSHKFLRNNKSIDHLIATALALLKLRNADGIHIRFENVGLKDKDYLTVFILKFRHELKKQNKNDLLALTIADEVNRIYDLKALNETVDWYIFESPKDASESVIENYLQQGLPKDKLLFGLWL